ncbi:ThuA domain-containing protein [Salinisphaera sp. LB1]|uniref:ThuA domain-containing protein n=1 Tax=Salinisphaera sp. LB1 TaxID=2183911 RepID=UPI000D7E8295|nr:ThuA domain-containing protein [Salinisphaera sp. LB1]AWN17344.1 putative protein-signal peptide prediction [Salinisphaera sp. LB1]
MTDHGNGETRIVLVAGAVRSAGVAGHHDYAGGCRLLATLLNRVPGVSCVVADQGWPDDESVLTEASAVAFYDNGGGKQGFLADETRRARLLALASRGCGLALLHQAAGFPQEYVSLGQQLFGGVYVAGESGRGHWKSRHQDFPRHPITQDLRPWTMRDGWLNDIRFAIDTENAVTPLLWSDKQHAGDAAGGSAAVVSWAFAPPARGRAFVFTGGDNHRIWQEDSVRRLIASGLLWSAGATVPRSHEWSAMSSADVLAYQTPRTSPIPRALKSFGRRVRRTLSGRRKW